MYLYQYILEKLLYTKDNAGKFPHKLDYYIIPLMENSKYLLCILPG